MFVNKNTTKLFQYKVQFLIGFVTTIIQCCWKTT